MRSSICAVFWPSTVNHVCQVLALDLKVGTATLFSADLRFHLTDRICLSWAIRPSPAIQALVGAVARPSVWSLPGFSDLTKCTSAHSATTDEAMLCQPSGSQTAHVTTLQDFASHSIPHCFPLVLVPIPTRTLHYGLFLRCSWLFSAFVHLRSCVSFLNLVDPPFLRFASS